MQNNNSLDTIQAVREQHLAEKIVIINGQPGCGKTMLSPIISALDRVELLTYAYEIENVCSLYYIGKIDVNSAASLIRNWTDLKLYNLMMSREVNFRPGDISSAFNNLNRIRYVKRLFQKGDEAVPDRIKKERPILHLTTHNLLVMSEPVFAALGKRAVFIEVVRHPLYMLKQQALNMERLLGDVRHFTVYFKYKDTSLPFWAFGLEERFLKSNNIEKTIYIIEMLTRLGDEKIRILREKYGAKIVIVPFESFVTGPYPYMSEIENLLETKTTNLTERMMKKQNVPRKLYSEGVNLKIYKRCGWSPPEKDSNENKEFEIRRRYAEERASPEAMKTLDRICAEYEEKYMGGRKKNGEHYE